MLSHTMQPTNAPEASEEKDTVISTVNTTFERILSEKMPLLFSILKDTNHPLNSFIRAYSIQKIPYPAINPIIEKRTRTATIILGSLSGVPWAEPAYNVAKGGLGIFFAIHTTIIYGFGACWVWNRVIKDPLQKVSPEEKLLTSTSLHCQKTSCFILRQAPSIGNAISTAYTVYKYNTVKAFCGIAFIDSYAFSSLGFKYFCQGLSKIKGSFFALSPLEQEKKHLQQLLARLLHNVLNMTEERRLAFFSTCTHIRRSQPTPSKYLSHMFFSSSGRESLQPTIINHDEKSYLKNFSYLLALAIVGINVSTDVMLSNDGSENFISDISWVNILIALILNLPELALRILSCLGTVNDIFSDSLSSSTAPVFFPCITKLIPLLALLLALPTAAGPFYIISDVYADVKIADYFFATIGAVQEVIYEAFLLRKLAYISLEHLVSHSDNNEAKELVNFSKEIESIGRVTSLTSEQSINSATAIIEEQKLLAQNKTGPRLWDSASGIELAPISIDELKQNDATPASPQINSQN